MKASMGSATYFALLVVGTILMGTPAIAGPGCPVPRPPGRLSEQTVLATPIPGSTNVQVYYPGTRLRLEINPVLLKGTPDEYGRIEIPVKDIPALITGRGSKPAIGGDVSPEGGAQLVPVVPALR